MTQVEIGQDTSTRRENWTLPDEEQDDQSTDATESTVKLRKAADPTIVEHGTIYFQRCGGGRRVLRK